MTITRRTFLKGTAATAGTLTAAYFLYGKLDTLWAQGAGRELQEEWIPTTCWIGKQDCGILARRIGGRVVKLEGDPNHPKNRGTLCPKGQAQIAAVYDPNRVKTPLRRTNAKGVSGEWQAVSWDEALTEVADRINGARAKGAAIGKESSNNPFLIWQKGRSKAKALYDTAFVKTSGATKLHHGAYCSDSGYRACEYTLGPHGVLHPDFRHTTYLLSWGWNITNAGGNKTCWLTWPQQMLAAKERGLKIVHIDPRLRGAGPHADEWVPIRPGTDLALALALCHELIANDTIDREYLVRHTNSPYLIGEDGRVLRNAAGNELVWNTSSNSPARAGIETAALDGAFEVDGQTVKTSFRLFREHVTSSSAEWAADICDIPAQAIRDIARDLASHAMIGSTVLIDGQQIPHRPVAIMAYHMSQQELGFQAVRAMVMTMMLLGSPGAVGGQLVDFTWKIHKNYDGLENIEITDQPNVYLNKSKFYPINSNLTGLVAKVVESPERFGVEHLPEVGIFHMVNPVAAFPSTPDIKNHLGKYQFIAVIDPWMSETADLYADVVLPAATMEKYEGPLSASDQYDDAVAMRVPIMDPMFQSRSDIDIYLDLCEKAGLLFGTGGYIDEVNKALKIQNGYQLALDRKPTPREIYDQWAKSEGIPGGISYFENQGVYQKGPLAASKRYGYATTPVFGGATHRLYGEGLLRYQREMRDRGVDSGYWQDYTPFPEWRAPTMESSPAEYDMYLISYKLVEFKQARTTFVPLLNELMPDSHVYLNSATARGKGINEGDLVRVVSHNAVTGETRSIEVPALLSEGVRPDTVAMPHHYGMWTHPMTKNQGPGSNELFFTGQGYVTNTADQSYHVKVKVIKL